MMFELFGSAEISEQEVCGSTNSTRFQDFPPSTVLNTPRSSLGPHSRPMPHAKTRSALCASITMRAILSDFSRPMCVQCSPPSTDLYIPSPIDALLRGLPSPVPTYITFGSLGAIAIAPIDETSCLSKTGLKVVPPFVV